jgi:hypothetical protein
MTLNTITEFYTDGSVFVPTQPQNFKPSHLKASSNKIMIQIKLVGMSMTCYCTKFHLFMFSGSQVVCIKHKKILVLNCPPSLSLIFHKKKMA